MTVDRTGQGIIDFTDMFAPHKYSSQGKGNGARRSRVKPQEAVPAEELASLNVVRERSGFNCKEVADAAGLTNNFVYRALHGVQAVRREDYDIIFKGLAKLVFRKIEEA